MKRQIVIFVECPIVEIPDTEVYRADTEHDVEMALLNDLVTPLSLIFVGGSLAKEFAQEYQGAYARNATDAKLALYILHASPQFLS